MERAGKAIRSSFTIILIVAAVLFVFAIFRTDEPGEPYTGNFDLYSLSSGWTIHDGDTVITNASLPITLKGNAGKTVRFERTLPDNVRDGMRLSYRSSRQEVRIFIDGEQRSAYLRENMMLERKSVVSAYVLADLFDKDAGKTVVIEVTSDLHEDMQIKDVSYSYGNNLWFWIIKENISLVLIAFTMLVVGFLAIGIYFFTKTKFGKSRTVLYLGETVLIAAMWMLGESKLRQLIFGAPSLSNIFSFLLIESVAAFGLMYMNEVQDGRYQKIYTYMQTIILIQVVVNLALNGMNVVDFYDTLILSHGWSALTVVAIAVTLVLDIATKRVVKYRITAICMMILLFLTGMEFINFYFLNISSMGSFLGIGLVILMGGTGIQAIKDSISRLEEERRSRERRTRSTFSTIAATIDAKDQYTGGHSERVGMYASKLLKKVSDKYGFTDEDVSRIRYIGKLHDIGKIGIPDAILNKNGKLNNEEFECMKQHTIKGYEILKKVDYIPGLQEGIRGHHERWDGKGYPDNLAGEDIHIYARILCLADSYDAMTTDRVYRPRLKPEDVAKEIENNSGSQFDPDLAKAFLDMIRSGEIAPELD